MCRTLCHMFFLENLRVSFPEKIEKNGPKITLHAKRNTYEEGAAQPGPPRVQGRPVGDAGAAGRRAGAGKTRGRLVFLARNCVIRLFFLRRCPVSRGA